MSKINFIIMKYGQRLPPTFCGYKKLAIFSTNFHTKH